MVGLSEANDLLCVPRGMPRGSLCAAQALTPSRGRHEKHGRTRRPRSTLIATN